MTTSGYFRKGLCHLKFELLGRIFLWSASPEFPSGVNREAKTEILPSEASMCRLPSPLASEQDACINFLMSSLLLCEFRLEQDWDKTTPDNLDKNLISGFSKVEKEEKIAYRSVWISCTSPLCLGDFSLPVLLIFA